MVFRNAGGEWHVWKRHVTTGDAVVGPGYVGRLVRPDGAVIADDLRESGQGGDPRYGGLGMFGWHHARAGQGAWGIDGRRDAAANGGFGVARAVVTHAAEVGADGLGRLALRVEFRDGWRDPILAVTYDYRFEERTVWCWISARQLWEEDGAGPAFVKEPKLAVSVAAGYRRAEVGAPDGSLLEEVDLAALPEPAQGTAQIGDERRCRVRFADSEAGAAPFDVAMEAWAGSRAEPWHVSAHGFDRWAQLANDRPRLSGEGGPYCLDAGGLRRRWELVKRPDEPPAAVFFPAWEGGFGYPDCANASRAFGPYGEHFTVLATYS